MEPASPVLICSSDEQSGISAVYERWAVGRQTIIFPSRHMVIHHLIVIVCLSVRDVGKRKYCVHANEWMAKEAYSSTLAKWQCTTLTDVSNLMMEVCGGNRA
jgi:hypothetical protein